MPSQASISLVESKLINIYPVLYTTWLFRDVLHLRYCVKKSFISKFLNASLFLVSLLEFLLINTLLVTWQSTQFKYLQAAEFMAQMGLKVSLFLLSCPTVYWQKDRLNISLLQTTPEKENLIAIKNILYGDFSSFIIITVLVLLVALIGAAVLVRSNSKLV